MWRQWRNGILTAAAINVSRNQRMAAAWHGGSISVMSGGELMAINQRQCDNDRNDVNGRVAAAQSS